MAATDPVMTTAAWGAAVNELNAKMMVQKPTLDRLQEKQAEIKKQRELEQPLGKKSNDKDPSEWHWYSSWFEHEYCNWNSDDEGEEEKDEEGVKREKLTTSMMEPAKGTDDQKEWWGVRDRPLGQPSAGRLAASSSYRASASANASRNGSRGGSRQASPSPPRGNRPAHGQVRDNFGFVAPAASGPTHGPGNATKMSKTAEAIARLAALNASIPR